MKLKYSIGILLSIMLFGACNQADENGSDDYKRELGDSIKIDAIKAGFEDKDSAIVEAYVYDSSTITINDIDPKDRSYTTRSKTLYKPGSDGKTLAVVYGYKAGDQLGMAVVQKVGEKPITLKEKENKEGVRTYSDGKNILQKAGTFAFLNNVQYEEVR